ncbi:ATP-binding protein, partial [Nocardiopsis trehalosi]|uniref:ATP-binding protein n=1 Tax=Nocardiopsis trehalosi TaxID=109329 RepID=UPI000835E236
PPPPPTAPARAPAPAATGAQRARAALPVPLTALVGRDADLDRVGALLRAHRLVTLTGPGGVGKTRLALAAAARAGDAALVELGALDPAPPGADAQASAARVAEAAAAALGVRDDAAGPPRAAADRTAGRLAAALSGERLLVLDNCEHVVAEAAALADLLLARAPGLRVLATSREPLGLTGEVLWPVAPLDVPPAGADDPDRVAASGAARLFAERAAAGVPGFAVDADTAAAVAAVCRRLDGLPLALELAAARVRALGVATLAERLDDRFHLLTMGARGAPSRQRTLRAVIDWSWEPLTEAERTVLRRLSVHADGCTLAAAEEVCAGGGVARGEVLDLLTRLVDRSLTAVSPTPDGPRYRLLESVAAYGAERLAEAGEAGDVRARHDAYYTRLAEEAAPALRGGGQRAWLRRLDAESAGLRSALDGAAGRGDADTALRLVDALAWYWYLRGRLGEAERALECALAVPGGDPSLRARVAAWRDGVAMLRNGGARPPGVGADAPAAIGDPLERARAEWFLLHAQAGFGDLADSGARLDRVLAVFRAHGDRWGTAAALQARASQGLVRGAVDAFERDATESAALFCELGDDWGTLLAMGGLGLLAEITGDYDRAAELHREGVRLAEELGLWSAAGAKLAALGRVALLRGDFAAAEEAHERARRMAVEQADVPGEQFAEIGLALGARRQGRLDAAEGYLRRWADWLRRLDGDPGLALVLAELGFAAEQRGDAAAALALHLDGLAAARATGDARAVALALEGLAGARSIGGEPEAAARLLGTAEALRASVGVPLPPAERGDVDRVAARVAAAVGAGVLAAELRRGRAMAPEDHPGVPAGAPHRGGAGAGVRPEGAPAGGP